MIGGVNKVIASNGLGYMLAPYTNYSDKDLASSMAARCAAELVMSGLVVVAPTPHGHEVDRHIQSMLQSDRYGEATRSYAKSHGYWMVMCERLFLRCEYGVVAMMDGWERSKGISMEIYLMAKSGKQVLFYDPGSRILWTFSETRDLFPEKFDAMTQLAADNMMKVEFLHQSANRQSESFRDVVQIMAKVGAQTVLPANG